MKRSISWTNYAVSGARAQDVLKSQLPKALTDKPDVVLIAVGANDIDKLTSPGRVTNELRQCIEALRGANPKVAIVLTGAPAMGAVPRFPQPIRWYAGVRTANLNKAVIQLTKETHTTFAPIADKTGQIFHEHPEFFAADKFHPNAHGYQVWKPVINHALDAALSNRP
jgi:lysophospholipase L1-like esterase